jgi:predicted phosphodiesterase
MAVSWFTWFSERYHPVVFYGNTTEYKQQSAAGFTKTYTPSKGYFHTAIMTNLLPNTRYYYSCGDKVSGMSDPRSFVTPDRTSSELIILGDLGTVRGGDTKKRLLARVQENVNKSRPSMLLHVGDIAYADDYPGQFYEPVFNTWFTQMQGVMDYAPYMVLPGNHDRGCKVWKCDPNNLHFNAYNKRFTMLPSINPGHSMWYSFNYGPYHIVFISTETDFLNAPYDDVFGDQLTWFRDDLKKANLNRKERPWIIVMGHRPMYCSTVARSEKGQPIHDAKHIQTAFEDIMHEEKVDVFMAGHVHAYERCYPIYKANLTSTDYGNVKGGVIHITNGDAGSIEGRIAVFQNVTWSVTNYRGDFGYGIMTTSSDELTHSLTWKFFSSSDDILRDSFTTTKSKL